MDACLGNCPLDTPAQETVSLPTYMIMDIIYHFMPTKWKNKMIEQGFNYAESRVKGWTDFFKTRVDKLKLREY